MYEIELRYGKWKSVYKTKNEQGQILTLEFLTEDTQKHLFYFVTFYIGKRKEGYQYMKTTGKDGLKSLIWAKNCIKHFINYIKELPFYLPTDNELKHTIVIQWEDNRRRDAYYYGLKSLKFYYGMYNGMKTLMHDIKR